MTPASPTLPLLQSLHDVTVHWPSKGETVKSASALPATLLFTYRWRQWRQICSLKIFIAFAILFSAARIPVRMPRLLQNESLRAVGMLGRGTSVSITAVDPLEHLDRLGCGCGVTRQLSLTFPEMGALGWRPGNTIITSHWHTRGTDFRQQQSLPAPCPGWEGSVLAPSTQIWQDVVSNVFSFVVLSYEEDRSGGSELTGGNTLCWYLLNW